MLARPSRQSYPGRGDGARADSAAPGQREPGPGRCASHVLPRGTRPASAGTHGNQRGLRRGRCRAANLGEVCWRGQKLSSRNLSALPDRSRKLARLTRLQSSRAIHSCIRGSVSPTPLQAAPATRQRVRQDSGSGISRTASVLPELDEAWVVMLVPVLIGGACVELGHDAVPFLFHPARVSLIVLLRWHGGRPRVSSGAVPLTCGSLCCWQKATTQACRREPGPTDRSP